MSACVCGRAGVKRLTSVEGGRDGVYAVASCTLAHGGMMEAEARCASLRIVGVQVEEAEFTPEWHTIAG